MTQPIGNIVQRGKIMDEFSLIINRINKLFPNEKKEDNNHAKEIEISLDIKLPFDFYQLNKYFKGESLIIRYGLFSFDPSAKGYNVIDKTLSYRNAHNPLPHKYLALGENSVSFIALDTETGKVIEMATNDYGNLVGGEELCDNPQYFNSFTDFFAFLLDEEEKERAENM